MKIKYLSLLMFKNKFNENQIIQKKKIMRIIINQIYKQNIIKKLNVTKNKWVIFLTTAVNVNNENEYRINLYTSQIIEWLNNTNFHIYVVESTGYNFNIVHERLTLVSLILPKLPSSTISESMSLMYLLNSVKNDVNFINCTHILKVTGRYYLENIKNFLENKCINNLNVYLQFTHNYDILWQNTEYYGIDKKLLEKFLLTINSKIMEHAFYDFIFDHKLSYQRIGPFNNNIARGGDKIIIKNL